MRRLLFLPGMFLSGLLLSALAMTAAAQVLAPGTLRRAPVAVGPNNAVRVDPASDPTLARAEIDRLQRQNGELTRTIANLRNRLDETTHPGGTLVHAYCGSNTQSRNTAGATEECADAGYTCEPVTGLCRTSCQTSDQCSPGFLCDTGIERCVRP